jgi:peroxiredoxin
MESPAHSGQTIGARVDDFQLESVQGGERTLASFLEGKIGAVVLFWSGVCSHCVRYDGYLNGFYERHPELSLVVVASRHGESAEFIRKTIAERGLAFPILHDPDGQLARQWSTQQTPRAFLISDGGTLLYRGAIDNFKYPADPGFVGHLESAIAQFLSGKPVLRAETSSFGCAIQSVYYNLPKHL